MTPWTQAAEDELQNYFSRIRPALEASGADPQEVIDDLQRHLDAEIANAGLTVVTGQDVLRLLTQIGAPEPPQTPTPPPTTKTNPVPRSSMGAFVATLLLLAGVVLPAATLVIEGFTHMCAAAFFDPMPTIWHSLLIAFLVAANWMTWNAVRENNTRRRTQLGWINGAAIAIAAFYAFLFIPLVVPGLIAIIVFGWGLLPLSPLLALIAAVVLRIKLRALDPKPDPALPGFWRGALLGLLALVLVEAPVILTQIGMQMAISDSAQTQKAGLGWLRRIGTKDILLRSCYGFTRGAQNMDLRGALISGNDRVSPEQARELYYRVTGRAFNSVPPPTIRTGRGIWAELDDWTWDADHGGDKVGGRIRGLTLNSSRLDTFVDADAAWSYTEWTFEFRNDGVQAREARAQILLPPGGVVSRVTLWVNDEEREAAFAGRSHVREAYKKVAVQQRRDPILVTTSGPDRILMQCFPVPARGGAMKVRVGITAPLILESLSEGLFRLPAIMERNFSIPEGTEHAVWVETGASMNIESDLLAKETKESGQEVLRGRLTNNQLASPKALVQVHRDPAILDAWTQDTRSPDGSFIRQSIVQQPVEAPKRLVVVVDGSQVMNSFLDQIVAGLEEVDPTLPTTVLAASDGVVALREPGASERSGPASPANSVRLLRALGGQDNVPALIEAHELASKTPGSVVLWIHAPQPMLLSSPDPLLQACERNPNGPSIYEIQTEVGADAVINKLNGLGSLHSIPRLGSLEDDLQRLFNSWSGQASQPAYERRVVSSAVEAQAGNAVETSLQIARLWALDQVRPLRATRKVVEAVKLAALYQLVTPVSGAVVLENAQQYQETGLKPVDPQTVPSVPEPSTFALFLLAGGALLVMRRSRRRLQRCC